MAAHRMALEIILKHHAASRFKAIGDAFYDETRERSWANVHPIGSARLASLWMGYRTAVVRTPKGPQLLVDSAATCMIADVRAGESKQAIEL